MALNYLHKQGIMHKDIKPDNILMTSTDANNLDLKVSDMGFATFFYQIEGENKDFSGSALYMAPELLLH